MSLSNPKVGFPHHCMAVVACVSIAPTTLEHLRRDSSASHSGQSTIHLRTHTPTHLSIHPSIDPTQPFTSPSIQKSIHPLLPLSTHPPTHPGIHNLPLINPSSTHPSICLLLTHLSLYVYPHPLDPTHPGCHTTTFIVLAHSHSGQRPVCRWPLALGGNVSGRMRGDSRVPGPVLGEEGVRCFCCPSPSLAAPPSAAGAQMSGRLPRSSQPQQLGEECASFVC